MTIAYNREYVTATIANAGTTSDAIALLDRVIGGIITPAALTGTTLTFTVCNTADGTYVALYDSDNNQVSLTVTVSRAYGVTGPEADALAPWPFVKIVSGSAEGAARSLVVCLK